MNDHDAMEAINTVVDEYLRQNIDQTEALNRICRISGQNSIEHHQ